MNILKNIIIIIIFHSLVKPTFANIQQLDSLDSLIGKTTSDLIILKNENDLIPLKNLNTITIASVSLGKTINEDFEQSLSNYSNVTHYQFNTFSSKRIISAMVTELSEFNLVIINTDEINPKSDQMISLLTNKNKVIINYFGIKQELDGVSSIDKIDALIVAKNNSKEVKIKSAQLTFGGIACNGKLNEKINNEFIIGSGITTNKIRLSFGGTESTNIDGEKLLTIDTLVQEAINAKAFPGCQIIAAKDGHVFLNKSYGNHTYDSTADNVIKTDIYDLASITKIASSAAILMDLQSKGLFHVDSTLGKYLPELVDSTDYENLTLKQILTHQAGLVSWIPFFIKTLDDGQPSYELYSKLPSSIHQNRVADDLYMLSSYRDTIFKRIINTKVKARKKYRYSDLGYYFVNEIIHSITNKTQDDYSQMLYDQLGLYNIGYKPREKWDLNRLIPTENDTLFRHQLVHGDVHDQGAALMGGVSGHAGLFSSAQDLAVIMQMYLNNGIYGGDTLIDPNVLEYYTSSPFYENNDNRRGITFDKPVRSGAGGPTCFECASFKSFGHSGFTGNLTWADPESGIVYVFLSNRVHPNAENKKLITMNVRTNVQKVITEACGFSTATATDSLQDLH